jgi:hypothetical protein
LVPAVSVVTGLMPAPTMTAWLVMLVRPVPPVETVWIGEPQFDTPSLVKVMPPPPLVMTSRVPPSMVSAPPRCIVSVLVVVMVLCAS